MTKFIMEKKCFLQWSCNRSLCSCKYNFLERYGCYLIIFLARSVFHMVTSNMRYFYSKLIEFNKTDHHENYIALFHTYLRKVFPYMSRCLFLERTLLVSLCIDISNIQSIDFFSNFQHSDIVKWQLLQKHFLAFVNLRCKLCEKTAYCDLKLVFRSVLL